MDHRYRMLYRMEPHPEGVAKADIPKSMSACDAVLMLSLIYPADGSFSMLIIGKDGRTGEELEENEWFKCWALMAKRLSESKVLPEGKKALARALFEAFREGILAGRDEPT